MEDSAESKTLDLLNNKIVKLIKYNVDALISKGISTSPQMISRDQADELRAEKVAHKKAQLFMQFIAAQVEDDKKNMKIFTKMLSEVGIFENMVEQIGMLRMVG